jgi:hypothetical protein
MDKAERIIDMIQKEYHYTRGEVFAKYPELQKQAFEELLQIMRRNARIRRWKLIRR